MVETQKALETIASIKILLNCRNAHPWNTARNKKRNFFHHRDDNSIIENSQRDPFVKNGLLRMYPLCFFIIGLLGTVYWTTKWQKTKLCSSVRFPNDHADTSHSAIGNIRVPIPDKTARPKIRQIYSCTITTLRFRTSENRYNICPDADLREQQPR